ncbi:MULTISPECIES: hypothetical protein [Streptomyces]|uniref:Uncharacterized protein n=1 Tax=Streptomyces ramulosus TaxID=47762 RepID=A0ABW1FDJ7_9ACTN
MKAFAGSGQNVTDSSAVGTDGTPSWLSGFTTGTSLAGAGDMAHGQDVWWSFRFSVGSSDLEYFLGATMDWGGLDSGPFHHFVQQPEAILGPVAGSLKGNDVASLGSFDTAGITLRGLERRLDGARGILDAWAREVNEDDSNWQGSAAGVFRTVLHGMADELDRLRIEMTTPRDIAAELDRTRTQMHSTLTALLAAHRDWRADRMAWPVNAVHDALQEAMQGASVSFGYQTVGDGSNPEAKVTSSYGDPSTQGFWDRVQSRAKALWLANVYTRLDQPAGQHMQALTSTVGSTGTAIPQQITPLRLRMPGGGAGGTNPFGPGTSPFGSGTDPYGSGIDRKALPPEAQQYLKNNGYGSGTGPDGAGGPDGSGAGPEGARSSVDEQGKGDGARLPGGSGKDGPEGGKIPDVKQFAQQLGGGTGGIGDGSTDGHAGGEGDRSGHVPPGMIPPPPPKIQPPMTGTSGGGSGLKTSPFGSGGGAAKLVGPDGRTLTDRNGHAVDVPRGSKINADGTVTRPDGTLATDRNGNQLTVPRGTKLHPVAEPPHDGSVWRERKMPENVQLPGGKGGSGGATAHPPVMPRGLSTVSGLGGGGAGGGGGASSGEIQPPRTGMSPKAFKNGGSLPPPPPEEFPPGGRGGRGGALQEATSMGRSTSSGGSPMVPPMGAGGAGAGAGGQGGDRERATWVDEEEEVWGTDGGATPGVIGR